MYPLNDDDVQDLLEEVLVVAWRRLDVLPSGHELPWLIGVARNVLNNGRRRYDARSRLHARLPLLNDEASAEDHVVAQLQMERAWSKLNHQDREILLLSLWDGLGIEELAIALSISPNAAAVRLSRAMSRLRASFENAGESGVTALA